MKILITGNLGYVGTELSKFIKKNFNNSYIIGLDANYFSDKIFNYEFNPNIYVDKQINLDIRNIKIADVKDCDAVIHLAAISNDPIGNKFKFLTNRINYLESVRLAKICLKSKVKSFVFASSCSVYGQNDNNDKKEHDILNPLTAYAKSKINTENKLQKFSNGNMQITNLRFGTACGYSDRIRFDLVLNDFVCDAYFQKKINIQSDGLAWRPFIDVEDMCRAICWGFMKRRKDKYLTVNVGSMSCNIQIRKLAEIVKNTLPNCTIHLNEKNKSDKRSYKVDFGLFNNLALNFRPKVSIKKSIQRIYQGLDRFKYKKNFDKNDYIRLKNLNYLISQKKLNKSLIWK